MTTANAPRISPSGTYAGQSTGGGPPLNLGTLTIASGILTLPANAATATSLEIAVTGENGLNDQLDNIVGGLTGQIVTLIGSNQLRTIDLPGYSANPATGFKFSTGSTFQLTLSSAISFVKMASPLGNGWVEIGRINQPS